MWRSSWQRDISLKEYIRAMAIGTTVLCIISYLFFNSIEVFIFSLPLLIPYVKSWEKQQEVKMKQEFIKQFREYLQALAASLATGYAVENAVVEARLELQRQYVGSSRLINDLLKMEQLLRMNIPIVDI